MDNREKEWLIIISPWIIITMILTIYKNDVVSLIIRVLINFLHS